MPPSLRVHRLALAAVVVLSAVWSLTASSASAAAGPQYGAIGQYGEVFRGGGFDSSGYASAGGAYATGGANGALTPGKFIDPVGFAVDTHDATAGGDGTAVYVLDRTSNAPASVSGTTSSWRLQKLSDTGGVLGTDELSLPTDASTNTAYYEMLGLTVDPASGRVYALVVGNSGSVTSAAGNYVEEIVAWSTTPSGGKLVGASGLTADGLSTGLGGFGKPAVLSTSSQLITSGVAQITDPQGLALDTTGGTHYVGVQNDDDSGGTGGTGVAAGWGITQISPATGAVTRQWSSNTPPFAAPASGQDRYSTIRTAAPGGIATGSDGSLLATLSDGSGSAPVVSIPADLTSAPSLLNSSYTETAALDFRTVLPPLASGGPAQLVYPDGGAGRFPLASSAQVVGLSNGLVAAVFGPDPGPNPDGSPQRDSSNPSPTGGGDWTPLSPGVRLISPAADGTISDQGFPVTSIFDTVGNPTINSSPNTAPVSAAASACSIGDAQTQASVPNGGGSSGGNSSFPSLANGANGALWVLTKGTDSSPQVSVYSNPLTGGRELIELAPNAGNPCPSPAGTFKDGASGQSLQSASSVLSVYAGQTVDFDGSSIDNHGAATNAWQWSFAGGQPSAATNASDGSLWAAGSASTRYATAGTYTASVKMFGDFGEYDQSATINVMSAPGEAAAFSFNPDGAPIGTSVAFDGSASTPSTGGSSITNYEWDWGDGTVDDTAGPTDAHTYAAAGSYNVRLTVTDGSGLTTAPTTKTVTVAPAPAPPAPAPNGGGGSPAAQSPPSAAFSFSPTGPQTNQPVAFDASGSKAQSGASLANYHWSWGDGSSSDTGSATESHTYATPGQHTVQLTVRDSQGLPSAVVSHELTVSAPAPQVHATIGGAASPTKGVAVTVSCPGAQPSCNGTIELTSVAGVAAAKKKPKTKPLVLGTAAFHLKSGATETVHVKLTGRAQALLRKHRTLSVIAIITDSSEGKTATSTRRMTLHYVTAKNHKRQH